MKGVSVNQLRALASKVLAKMDQLLTTEPARVIGYGAAVVVFLAVQGISYFKPGVLPAVTFDEAIGMAFAAISTLVILIESIRRFVFSPQTYIEDIADESEAAHEAAHIEEEAQRFIEGLRAQQAAAAQPQTKTVTVGSAKAANTSGKLD